MPVVMLDTLASYVHDAPLPAALTAIIGTIHTPIALMGAANGDYLILLGAGVPLVASAVGAAICHTHRRTLEAQLRQDGWDEKTVHESMYSWSLRHAAERAAIATGYEEAFLAYAKEHPGYLLP